MTLFFMVLNSLANPASQSAGQRISFIRISEPDTLILTLDSLTAISLVVLCPEEEKGIELR